MLKQQIKQSKARKGLEKGQGTVQSQRNPYMSKAVAQAFLTHKPRCIRWLCQVPDWQKQSPPNGLLIVFWQPWHILQGAVKAEIRKTLCHLSLATQTPASRLQLCHSHLLMCLETSKCGPQGAIPGDPSRLFQKHPVDVSFKHLLDLVHQLHYYLTA